MEARQGSYGALLEPVLTQSLRDLVTTGEVISLQHTIEPGIPVPSAHVPLTVAPYLRHGDPRSTFPSGGGFASEITIMSQHTGTHVDALSHFHKRVGDVDYLYGPVAMADQTDDLNLPCGAERMPPIVGRGLLLDVPECLGLPLLPQSFEVTVDHLEACLAREGARLAKGDIVIFRTGYAKHWPDSDSFLRNQPGIGLLAAEYLASHGVVVVGSDTATVEVLPSPNLAVHEYLLVDVGIPMFECLNLEELSHRGHYVFVFVAAPLKIRGATGSVVNPLAIL